MKLCPHLREAIFLERLNRFAALARLNGSEVMAHVPNSGRMRELLQPGNRCLLAPALAPGRKTAYDLALVDLGHELVSCDARVPSSLVAEAVRQRGLAPFKGYTQVQREVVFGDSRLDLLLEGPRGRCLLEVKSVTLVEGGVGLFPDAPTERGRRHVMTLARAVKGGYRAAMLFIIQREDARAFAPNDAADPLFGQALRRALRQGVEAYAYRCRVSTREITILDAVPLQVGRRPSAGSGRAGALTAHGEPAEP